MKVKEVLWYLNTTYACGGIITRDGVVIKTCPIYKKFLGRTIAQITEIYRKQIVTLLKIPEEAMNRKKQPPEVVAKYSYDYLDQLLEKENKRFTTKPVVIQAFVAPNKLKLPNGNIVEEGDYVVKHINGAFYGVKQNLFNKTYIPYEKD